MSRYLLRPRPEADGVARVAVGWDRPLRTFFVQVFGPPAADGEDTLLVWVGTAPGELANVAELVGLLAPFAELSDEIAARLEADRRDGHDRRDGPAQVDARRFVARR